MLDDLKKERQYGFRAREKTALSVYVAICLIVGATLLVALTDDEEAEDLEALEDPTVEVADGGEAWPDPDRLLGLATREVVTAEGPERIDALGTFSAPAVELVRTTLRARPSGRVAERLAAEALAERPIDEAIGRVFDVPGRVIERVRQEHRTEEGRLWALVLEGAGGVLFVAVKPGLASELHEGAPRADDEVVDVGDRVVVRGLYLQQRTGTIGSIPLVEPVPVLYATAFRRRPEASEPPPETLADIRFDAVEDRLMRHSRQLQDPALLATVAWARAAGHDALREAIASGALDVERWDQETFATWKEEIRVRRDDPRPFTEAARGEVFATAGLLVDRVYYGWDQIRPNPWGVEHLDAFHLLSDHYGNSIMRMVSAFPLETYDAIEGSRKEHVRVYGVFLKNYTYDLRLREKGKARYRPLTMPLFVVIHAERVSVAELTGEFRTFAWILAGGMLVFAFLFWFVLIRGERRQAAAMEAHRAELRSRRRQREADRAAGPGAEPPP